MYGKYLSIKNCVGFSKQSSVLVSFTEFVHLRGYLVVCARFCIAKMTFMTSYAWKMPLLLLREIRNLVREKSVKSQGILLSLIYGNPAPAFMTMGIVFVFSVHLFICLSIHTSLNNNQPVSCRVSELRPFRKRMLCSD